MERFWSLSKIFKKLLYLNKSLDYLFKIESGVTIILIKISLVQLYFLVVHPGLVPSSTPFSIKINGSYVISSIVLYYFKERTRFLKDPGIISSYGTEFELQRLDNGLYGGSKAQYQPAQSYAPPSKTSDNPKSPYLNSDFNPQINLLDQICQEL